MAKRINICWDKIKSQKYDDLGFAKIDHQRKIRSGFPEVIFCQGKNLDQIIKIIKRMHKKKANILATRAGEQTYKSIKKIFPKAKYDKLGKIISLLNKKHKPLNSNTIMIMTAGTSDIPIAQEAKVTAEFLGNKAETLFDVGVAGLHRLLQNLTKINQASVIIVIAGMEGALASVVAGLVDKPIIAVPSSIGYGASFKGLSALLGMLNTCSPGVAVVNIDNGFGAACLASTINKMRPIK